MEATSTCNIPENVDDSDIHYITGSYWFTNLKCKCNEQIHVKKISKSVHHGGQKNLRVIFVILLDFYEKPPIIFILITNIFIHN